MKRLLSKMFFASDCSKGMLFALTLVSVGNYLWFSFWHLLALWAGRVSPGILWTFGVGAGLIALYALIVAGTALAGLIRVLRSGRDSAALRFLIPAGLCLAAFGIWWTGAIVVFFYLSGGFWRQMAIYLGFVCLFSAGLAALALYVSVVLVTVLVWGVGRLRGWRGFHPQWRLALSALCTAAGVIGAIRMFPPLYVLHLALSGKGGLSSSWLGRGFQWLPNELWGVALLLSLILIAAGGVLLAAVFPAAEGKKFRSAFGWPTLALWAVFALGYVVFLGLAAYESRRVTAARNELERRFGRPLTAAGLESLYHERGKVDAEFWRRLKRKEYALPDVPVGDGLLPVMLGCLSMPDRPNAAVRAWFESYCRANRAAIDKWDGLFDRVPPLPPKNFIPGRHVYLPGAASFSCDYVPLLRWRLFCALAVGDIDTAWTSYLRLGNIFAAIRAEVISDHSLDDLGEDELLDCVEKLLESRLLSDDRLDRLDADLAKQEKFLTDPLSVIYPAAVRSEDRIFGFETGVVDLRKWGIARWGAFASYRPVMPQWHWHIALDHLTMLRFYLAPDLARDVSLSSNEWLFMSTEWLSFNYTGEDWCVLIARVRGMRVLIRAERYRRKHGEFPKTLADLPPDPFTGKPLVYEVGKTEIVEIVGEKRQYYMDVERIKKTVDAVMVHSDPALVKARRITRWGRGDKTRAMIRIR